MMNEPIHITLLGGLQIQQGDRSITRFKSQKIGALLAYLAYHLRTMHPRELLIDRFWPESTLEAGRNSLSVALSTLRHQLEPPGAPANAVLRADRFAVGLNSAAVTTDVARFESALYTAAQAHSPTEQIQRLVEAVDLYQGPLLPGFYEEWIPPAQEQLAGRFLETITQLIERKEASGDLAGALGYARRAVGVDPLQEPAHHHLLRLLAATGQPGAALRHYKELERLLEEELGEEPSAPLRALARQIEKQAGFTAPLTLPTASTIPRPLSSPPASGGPPQGPITLTFLLTDIEGSTRLWERTGDAFVHALQSHHTLLRREFARYGGQEIHEAGDAFVVAFPSAGKALLCAVAGQQALQEHAWPQETGPMRVRMALHTGDVEYREGDYHGLTLHRAARMLTSGHGGQVLCSEATAGLLRRDLEEAVRLVDLGIWRLRDVSAPERLFQVEYPGMPTASFPPLSAEAGHAARLPLRFTRFFGRDAEIARLVERLKPAPLQETPIARLLTLTGSGGTGKTRLALEVAERLVEAFQGAVWFAPLADLSDPGRIADTLLDSLRLVRSPQQEPLEQIVAALSKQPALLVLDNFEHLMEGGVVLVQTLLTRVPALTILVTSRQRLGLSGEEEYVVPPLVTPNGGETAEQLSLYESVQLFVDRAQGAMPHFQVTSGNAPAVAELCQRLEGIPLAIELAAARALVLTPGQMLAQLGQRFEFLVSRKRDATERHRTLRAAMEWSYQLLTPELQRFFARLSVFRGGWTLEAAEAVCEAPLALDYLAQLRECSLASTLESESGIRFRMLESLREYAGEQMGKEERALVERLHTEYFLALAEEAERNMISAAQTAWLDRLEADHDNLRAVLKRCQEHTEDAEAGLRLAGSLWPFWDTRGYQSEGREYLGVFLSQTGAIGPTAARAKALEGAGRAAYHQNASESAQSLFNESLAIRRELGDNRGIAYSLTNLGIVAKDQGDYAAARALQEESLVIWRETGDKGGIAFALYNLGILAVLQGDNVSARSRQEESLAMFRELGYKEGVALTLYNLGEMSGTQGDDESAVRLCEESLATFQELGHKAGVAFSRHYLGTLAEYRGDYPLARLLYEECLPLWRELGVKSQAAWILHGLGFIACRQGDFAAARTLLKDCLTAFREIKHRSGLVRSLERFAGLAAAQRRMAQAGRLLAAAENLREAMGAPLALVEQPERNRDRDAIRTVLDEEEFAAAWAEGRAMTLEQAVAYALEAEPV